MRRGIITTGMTLLMALTLAVPAGAVGADPLALGGESAAGIDLSPQIYNGDAISNPGWVVSILADGRFICTGSLIHEEWVLTAAHCIRNGYIYSVRVGGDRWTDGIARSVWSVQVHPEWSGRLDADPDLALIRLSAPVTGVTFPVVSRDPDSPSRNQDLSVMGWGMTSSVLQPSEHLQGTTVYVTSDSSGHLDEDYCLREFVSPSGYSDFCFGGPVTSWVCSGDSGGPLVGGGVPGLDGALADVLYGIVSFGADVPCSEWIWDDVAERVGSHADWIDSVLAISQRGRFLDDDGSIFRSDIEWIASAGITKGCNPPMNDLYCPDDPVSRAEMAAFLRRALDLADASGDYFADDAGSVFEADINAVAAAGITRGCNPPANDRFCPDDTVSRGEMAAFLNRAFELPTTSGDYFVDDAGSVFDVDINAVAAAGITRGCNPPSNDRYCPDDAIDRGAMAALLRRAIGEG